MLVQAGLESPSADIQPSTLSILLRSLHLLLPPIPKGLRVDGSYHQFLRARLSYLGRKTSVHTHTHTPQTHVGYTVIVSAKWFCNNPVKDAETSQTIFQKQSQRVNFKMKQDFFSCEWMGGWVSGWTAFTMAQWTAGLKLF